MQKILMLKILAISAITILLLIPLNLILDKVSERSAYRYQARHSISQSWTGSQKLVGPLMVIPYVLERTEVRWSKRGEHKIVKKYKETHYKYLIPETLNISSTVETDVRYKGIYEVPVYIADFTIDGVFDDVMLRTVVKKIKRHKNLLKIQRPYLVVSVSDPRGINSIPTLKWGKQSLEFKPGGKFGLGQNGIHVRLPLMSSKPISDVAFGFKLELRGMESLNFSPTGKTSLVHVSSRWPHPEFTGAFLPTKREVSAEGFSAQWKITSFASNIENKVESCQQDQCSELYASNFGLRLIEPVDVYLQTERSVKYGLLFIVLSFVTFFLFEMLKHLRIHAIQYVLVGVAISIFYLLLISLSEHIVFWLAYLIASLSCVGLLSFYVSYVLKGIKPALWFTIMLSLLYGVLYVILQAEDFALLMGAILTFGVLGLVMFVTRRIDWYQMGAQLAKQKQVDSLAGMKPTVAPEI